MKTNATKFLAVLAVFAMAFAAFAVSAEMSDAAETRTVDLDFDSTVDFSNWSGASSVTTKAVKNTDIGNYINVKVTTENDITVYTITGYFGYQAQTGDILAALGMGTNNSVVFNVNIPSGVTITSMAYTTTDPTNGSVTWTAETLLGTGTEVEPDCFNTNTGRTIYIGYLTEGETAPADGHYAKIVFASEGTYTHYGAQNDVIVNEDTTLVDGTNADVIITEDVTITAVTTKDGLVKLGSGMNLFVAPGVTLTINASGTSPGGDNAFSIIKAAGASEISGGVGAKIVINDKTTVEGDFDNATSTRAIYALGKLTIDDITLEISQVADGSAGVYATGLEISNSNVTITSGNRALYDYLQDTVIKDNSVINVAAKEYGIRSADLTIGTANATDVTTVTARLVGQSGNNDPDEYYGIKSEGLVTINAGSTVTADAMEIVGKNSSVVNGTLKINASKYAGYTDEDTEEVYQPAGLVVVDEIKSKEITKMDSAELVIGATGKLTVSSGAAILAKISDTATDQNVTDNAASVIFGAIDTVSNATVVKYITVETDATFTHGSVIITGDFSTDTAGNITANSGIVTISGELESGVSLTIADGATLVVPGNGTLKLNENSITGGTSSAGYFRILGEISGSATTATTNLTVTATNPDVASAVLGVDVKEATDYLEITTENVADLAALAYEYSILYINSNVTLPASVVITLPSSLTFYIGASGVTEGVPAAGTASTLEIPAGTELVVSGAKIYDVSGTKTSVLSVLGTLTLDSADVCTPVSVDEDTGYVSILSTMDLQDMKGTLNSDVSIGYGNTQTFNGVTVPSGKTVYVYGILEADSANTIGYNGKLISYPGSTVVIDGSLAVEGIATTAGDTLVSGSLTIFRTAGGASFTNSGTFVVAADAKFDVTKPRQSGVNDNAFVNNDGADVIIFGTSTITGSLKGDIIDYGTVEFNGTAVNTPNIYLRSGVTLDVKSVKGTLAITDTDAAIVDTKDSSDEYKDFVLIYEGNTVTLEDVKNVSVLETVTVIPGKITVDDASVSVKYYVSTLSIGGSIASNNTADANESVTLTGGAVNTQTKYYAYWSPFVDEGCVNVLDTTVGKFVNLIFAGEGNLAVTGTIEVIAQYATITFNNTANIDVYGKIHGNDQNDFHLDAVVAGKINGTLYNIDDASGYTDTYVEPFMSAIESITLADDKEVYVYGYQEVDDIVSVPADHTVIVMNDSTLYVDAVAVMTVNAGGVLDSTAGTLVVDGVLIIMDKDTGLRYNTGAGRFVYQVKTEDETSISYSGLAGALARAEAGDIITLSQDANLYLDATIPEGVVLIVPSGKTLTLGYTNTEMTFTINGMLKTERNSTIASFDDNSDVTLVINGAVLADEDTNVDGADFNGTDFVYFTMKVDGRKTHVFSNLTYAAENVESGSVIVIGKVKAGDIVFTPADGETIYIMVLSNDETQNAISVNSMTLVNTELIISADSGENPGVVSGTVIAGSEIGVASIALKNATGITITADTEETAAGEVDHLYIKDTSTTASIDGTVEIVSGVVSTNDDLTMGSSKTSIFKVGENGMFIVSHGTTFAAEFTSKANVTIAGAMTVNGTFDVNGKVSVSGLLTVVKEKASSAATVNMNKEMTVTGTVLISENETLYGTFNVNAKLTVGTAATAVGDGAIISGPMWIANESDAFIAVYPGADISDAKINWNTLTESSDAVSTQIFVFKTLYATVFANSTSTVQLNDSVFSSSTKISGYDVKGSYDKMDDDESYYVCWFTDDSYKTNMTSNYNYVGNKSVVYFTPALATVYGTVTVGTGIDLYVDGKLYTKVGTEDVDYFTVGTHTVSVQIKTGYIGDNVTIKFNGTVVPATATGGSFTITADMESFTLVADGATPYTPEPTPEPEKESEWTITTILLCVLVVLIAIMAVIVALRLNRN